MKQTQPASTWKQYRFFISTMIGVIGIIVSLATFLISYLSSRPLSAMGIFHHATSGTPIFDSSNNIATQNGSWGTSWEAGPTDRGACQFGKGGYDIRNLSGGVKVCLSNNIALSDFALTVQMTIRKGNIGGIIFHWTQDPGDYHDFYYFYINIDGSYGISKSDLQKCPGNHCISPLATYPPDQAIKQGLGAVNDIAIVDLGNIFYLYANGRPLKSAQDNNSYNSGYIGFAAGFDPSEVVFSNAKIWGEYTANG